MAGSLMDNKRKVKIRRKISLGEFAGLLDGSTGHIVISDSIVRQSKSLGIMLDTLERVYNMPHLPTIEILERGKGPRVIRQDWLDPAVRGIVGKKPPVGAAVEIRLLNEGAVSQRKAVAIAEFAPQEIREISALRAHGHIEVTDDLRIYLSRLGIDIAKGAKRLYDL